MSIMKFILFNILMITITFTISLSDMFSSNEVILVNVNYCSIKSMVMVSGESPCSLLDGFVKYVKYFY